MDLDKARRIIDDRTHPDWPAAYATVQWHDIWRPKPVTTELVDWDEIERDDEADDPDGDDFTVDDRDVDLGPRFGCDGGVYFVETASGPGWIGRR